jgi:Lrp/AsnC family leucine-responsive transcriptional regulator
MDRTDWRILDELQADARLSINELGRRVALSAPSTGDRVRRLQDAGVVTGYHAHVDPVAVGRQVRAFVRMQCYGARCVLRDPAVASWPEVLQMHRVTGVDCTVMLVAVDDITAFQALLDRLAEYGRPESSMVLEDVVAWSPVRPFPGRGPEA